jgi:L-malate glycosyltransferase
MQKILIIENSHYITGAFNSIVNNTELMRSQFDFHFAIPQGSAIKDILEQKGYPVYEIPFLEISKRLQSLWYLPKLYRNTKVLETIIKENAIEVVHVNDIYNMTGCWLKKRNPGLYLIYHIRLLKTSYIGKLYKFFAWGVKKYADKIICVSQAVKNDFGAVTSVEVIYDTIKINEKYNAWEGLQSDALKVIYIGNYVSGKGQDIALEAFIHLLKKSPNASLKFVGATVGAASQTYKDKLQKKVQQTGMDTQVVFADKTNDIEKVMKEYDVVLNLSESESFSFVCLEALLYGVPLVASNSGGPAEITEDGQRAILVPNNAPLAAAEALMKIIENRSYYKNLAISSKIWARKKFDPQESLDKMNNIYSKQLRNFILNIFAN